MTILEQINFRQLRQAHIKTQ